MSESNTSGNGQGGIGGGAGTTTGQQTQQQQGGAAPEGWRKHIPEEFKDASFWGTVKDEADLVKQYAHAQKLIGSEKIPAPNDKWTDKEWGEFYARVGRPEVADKYSVAKDEKGADIIDAKELADARAVAFKLGLTDKQFVGLQQQMVAESKAEQEAEEKELKATIDGHVNELRSTYGHELKATIDLANKALEKLAVGDPKLKELLLSSPALANHPSIVRLLASIGKTMGEDSMRQFGVNASDVRTAGDAKIALAKLEQDNHALLFGKASNPADAAKRDALLEQRDRLYKIISGGQ